MKLEKLVIHLIKFTNLHRIVRSNNIILTLNLKINLNVLLILMTNLYLIDMCL